MTAKRIFIFFFLCFFTSSVSAQIEIPSDSISKKLCQKWKFKAIIMGGQRLTNMNESVTYEFIDNGTFKRVSSEGKTEKGTWIFYPEQKTITLKLKKTWLHIPSLSSDELIVSPGAGDRTKNTLGMGTVLKPAEEN